MLMGFSELPWGPIPGQAALPARQSPVVCGRSKSQRGFGLQSRGSQKTHLFLSPSHCPIPKGPCPARSWRLCLFVIQRVRKQTRDSIRIHCCQEVAFLQHEGTSPGSGSISVHNRSLPSSWWLPLLHLATRGRSSLRGVSLALSYKLHLAFCFLLATGSVTSQSTDTKESVSYRCFCKTQKCY